jgi:hypothetical protein
LLITIITKLKGHIREEKHEEEKPLMYITIEKQNSNNNE